MLRHFASHIYLEEDLQNTLQILLAMFPAVSGHVTLEACLQQVSSSYDEAALIQRVQGGSAL